MEIVDMFSNRSLGSIEMSAGADCDGSFIPCYLAEPNLDV